MAQIILSGAELVGVLQANGWVPGAVTALEADGREFRLQVRTPLPLLASVRVSVHFVGYENGRILLQFVTNRLMDRLGPVIDEAVKSLPLADYGARWEYPRLAVALNPLVRRRTQGVEIEDVVFRDGCFHIVWAVRPSSEQQAAEQCSLRISTDATAPELRG